MFTQKTMLGTDARYNSATGAANSATARATEATPPKGWHIQSLPDGLVSLKKTWWNSWGSNVLMLSIFLMGITAFSFYLFPENGFLPRELYICLLLGSVVYLVWMLAMILTKEDIHVGRNFLEYRRDFLFRHHRYAISTGYLSVYTEYRITRHQTTNMVGKVPVPGPVYYAHTWVRKLYAEDDQQRVRLLQTSTRFSAHDPAPRYRDFSRDEITSVAAYLSNVSGWQVQELPVKQIP